MAGRFLLLAAARLSLITSNQQGRRKRLEGVLLIRGKDESQRRQRPYQRPGCWASVKNRNQGRLASISAGVDGPIDSSIAAPGCWAIEGIRQSAYDEMRWGDNFWQALHPPPISNHPVCTHTHTNTHGEKVITTCMHAHTLTLAAPPVQVMALWLAEHPPVRCLLPSQSSCAHTHTKYLWMSLHSLQLLSLRVISLNCTPSVNSA